MCGQTATDDGVYNTARYRRQPKSSSKFGLLHAFGPTVNPAEFLYLMAQEYTAINQGAPAPVTLGSISALPLATTQNFKADPLTKLQFWTYKPAVFTVGRR